MRIILIVTLFLLVGASPSAFAKVGDPKPITVNNVTYQSHGNYVEAVEVNTEKQIWRKVLPGITEPDAYTSGLEKDVQWNIVCCLKVEDSDVEAQFRNVTDHLDRQTGDILNILTSDSNLPSNELRPVE